MKKHRVLLISSILFISTCTLNYLNDLNAQTSRQSSSLFVTVACSPDELIIYPNESVRLRAWAEESTEKDLLYTWSATAGKIEGNGSIVRWDLLGVPPGSYTATVHITYSTGQSVECPVQVIVRFPPLSAKGGGRETGRSFLLPNQEETKGYGLYSYVLLGWRPSNESRDRYLNAIIEYLKFSDISLLEKYLQRYKDKSLDEVRRTLNVTYLPIKQAPSQEMLSKLNSIKEEDLIGVAEWVLEKYDYERARVLVNNLPGDIREGPYIISFLAPLCNNPLSPPYLYQDQSRVPPNLVSLWIKEFLIQASMENYWQERTGKQFVLKLRTTIGILAMGLPDVKDALHKLIIWKE